MVKQIQIELEPQLDACVETQAKRYYKEFSGRILKGENGDLTQKLEVLRLFLESQDFNRLRAESEPHLVAGNKVKFIVSAENGRSVYNMKVEKRS